MNMQLQSGITQLEDRIEYLHAVNERVSSANVGWHIAHTCLATERIIGALQQSDPGEYRGKFNWIKSLVLLTRRIPRGRGKAPKSTLVHESISAESLHERIAAARAVIAGLGTLKADHHFLHPYFGQMNLKGTVKFLDIHIQHHLKIIDEIIKKQ